MLKNVIFSRISLRLDLDVRGHIGQGQRSHGSRSNKVSKKRQVGSRQRQVAAFLKIKYTNLA